MIITLRNPVARAISAINHIIRSQRISPLHNVNELLVGRKEYLVRGYGILDKGMYYHQLLEYQKLYPKEKILILIFEEMINHPQVAMNIVCEFLEISKNEKLIEKDKKINQSKFSRTKLAIDYHFPYFKKLTNRYSHFFSSTKIEANQETIQKLKEIYKEPNQKLFELIGREIDSWED